MPVDYRISNLIQPDSTFENIFHAVVLFLLNHCGTNKYTKRLRVASKQADAKCVLGIEVWPKGIFPRHSVCYLVNQYWMD